MQASNSLRQAAVLLSALPKPQLAAILKRLAPADAAALAAQLTRLGAVAPREVDAALRQFTDAAAPPLAPPPPGVAASAAASPRAAEDRRAEARETRSAEPGRLDLLEELPLDQCLSLLEGEEPHFLAAVLFLLTSKKAAAVVERMALPQRVAVLHHLAGIEAIPRATLEHIRLRLQRKAEFGGQLHTRPEGLHRVRQLMEQLNPSTQRAISDALVAGDAALSAELHRSVFRFGDLYRLKPEHLRKVIAAVDRSLWPPALRYAETRVRDAVLAALDPAPRRSLAQRLAAESGWTVEQSAAHQQQIVDVVNDLFARREIQRPRTAPRGRPRAA